MMLPSNDASDYDEEKNTAGDYDEEKNAAGDEEQNALSVQDDNSENDATPRNRFQQTPIKLSLPTLIVDLIRPGNLPFRLGLREPAAYAEEDAAKSESCCNIDLRLTKIMHHVEHGLCYSVQLSTRFFAVDQSTGQCLPFTTSLQLDGSSSYLKDDGNKMYHEINTELPLDCTEMLSGNTLLLFEVTAVAQCYNSQQLKAWAFFRPKRVLAKSLSNGNENLNMNIELQLYKWQQESLLARKQAEHHILPKATSGVVPAVFIQYLMQRKKKYNSSLVCRIEVGHRGRGRSLSEVKH